MEVEDKKVEAAPAQEEEKKGKKRWLLLLLLLLLFFATVVASVWALYFRDGKDTLAPDDTTIPPQIETNAEPVPGDSSDEKLDAPEGGGAVSLTYSKAVDINLTDQKA